MYTSTLTFSNRSKLYYLTNINAPFWHAKIQTSKKVNICRKNFANLAIQICKIGNPEGFAVSCHYRCIYQSILLLAMTHKFVEDMSLQYLPVSSLIVLHFLLFTRQINNMNAVAWQRYLSAWVYTARERWHLFSKQCLPSEMNFRLNAWVCLYHSMCICCVQLIVSDGFVHNMPVKCRNRSASQTENKTAKQSFTYICVCVSNIAFAYIICLSEPVRVLFTVSIYVCRLPLLKSSESKSNVIFVWPVGTACDTLQQHTA